MKEKIQADLKKALKNKEEVALSTLRMILASLKNAEIAKPDHQLTPADEIQVLQKEAKKRKEAIIAYEKGNRPELAAKEKKELEIIEKYLPKQLSEEEIRANIKKIITETGLNQFGPLMGKVMAELKGQADGAVVAKILKEELK